MSGEPRTPINGFHWKPLPGRASGGTRVRTAGAWRIAVGLMAAVLLLGLRSAWAGGELAQEDAPTNGLSGTATPGDLLQFVDGSSLHGRLISISTNQGVGWQHPDAAQRIDFKPTNIAWVRFEKPVPITAQSKPTCRFRFQNGDEVFGKLTAMDSKNLELQTWFGGALRTPQNALQSVTFLSKGYAITYEGPTSPVGWVEGRSARGWEYKDGAFIATGAGTLGHDFHLSGSSSLAFDLAWNGQFSLILALYTSVLDRFDYSTSSYMFYLNPGSLNGPGFITLQRIQGGAGAMNLGQAQIPDMGRRDKVHMEIRANKDDASLALLVDDKLVQRWKDNAGFLAQGTGVVFFTQLDGPSIRISNIKVAQWQGDFSIDSSTNAPGTNDVVYLINHDKVTGQIQHLDNDLLTIATDPGLLNIPVSRITQLCFAQSNVNPLPSSPWELRAFFAGGGTVAFRMGGWRNGHVSGISQNFGRVEFNSESIRQLQFNLDRSKVGADDMEILDQDVWDLE
jgi:hypothetical protein